jgi:hypothetical protein
MYRGWIFAVLVMFAGCASQRERPSASIDDPRTSMIAWPEWIPTSVALLELKENAGYTVVPRPGGGAPAPEARTSSEPPAGTTPSVPEAPPATVAPAHPQTPVTASHGSAPPAGSSDTEYVDVGKSVSFAATAEGSPPLLYQWRKNGRPIPGRTNAIFTLNDAKESDAGAYDCIVKNSAGETASPPIKLVVRKL